MKKKKMKYTKTTTAKEKCFKTDMLSVALLRTPHNNPTKIDNSQTTFLTL